MTPIQRHIPKRRQVDAVQVQSMRDVKEAAAWVGAETPQYIWFDRKWNITDPSGVVHKIRLGDYVLKDGDGKVLVLPEEAFVFLFSLNPVGGNLRAIYEEQMD